MTQDERIMAHLIAHGSITAKEAMDEYGIMRLAARIHALRHNGQPIKKVTCTGTNRFGDTVNYAKYYIE